MLPLCLDCSGLKLHPAENKLISFSRVKLLRKKSALKVASIEGNPPAERPVSGMISSGVLVRYPTQVSKLSLCFPKCLPNIQLSFCIRWGPGISPHLYLCSRYLHRTACYCCQQSSPHSYFLSHLNSLSLGLGAVFISPYLTFRKEIQTQRLSSA